jgi:uncharacterized protein (TIGR02246 family)
MLRIIAITLALGGSLLARMAPPQQSVLPAYSDAGIETLLRDYQSAFNRGDAKALAGLYTFDAWRVSPAGVFIASQAAIEWTHDAAMARAFAGATLALHSGRVLTISSDVALVEGTYELTTSGGPMKGRYLNTIVRRADRQWRLASEVNIPEGLRPAK